MARALRGSIFSFSRFVGAGLAMGIVACASCALVASCGTSSDDAPLGADDASAVEDGGGGTRTDGSGSEDGAAGLGDSGADGDVSADDAAPPPCTRAAEATTAPASLYDAFVADMTTLTGAARDARVDAFVADVVERNGTPLEDPRTGRAVFLARGAPPNGTWSVVGSFVGWDPAKALAMTQVADTDLWVLDTTAIAASSSHAYTLLAGTDQTGWVEDPLARNVTWDGVDRGVGGTTFNAGRFHGIVHPFALPAAEGRLLRHGFVHATMLGNDRRVFVYLPSRYDDGSCTPLPTVLWSDGNEALARADLAGAADTLYAATPALSAVHVFAELASPNLQQRVDEYSFGTGSSKGAEYVDFLASDLWPLVRATYRVCTKQAARGIAGGSLGGLIASFAAFEKPTEWGWVGSQSGSYWWNGSALVTRAQTSPKVSVRFYLDSSCPNDNCTDVDAFASALQSKGYDYVRVKIDVPVQPPDPHDWTFFKTRAPQLLTHFRDGLTACN